MRLCEMLVIVLQQLAVDCGHCHEYVNLWRFRTQEFFPNLEETGSSIHQLEASMLGGHMEWQKQPQLQLQPHGDHGAASGIWMCPVQVRGISLPDPHMNFAFYATTNF